MKKYLLLVLALPLLFKAGQTFAEAEYQITFEEPQSSLIYQVAEGDPIDPLDIIPEITLEDLEQKLTDIDYQLDDIEYKVDIQSQLLSPAPPPEI